eukprot:1160336-Pelagomonas_calceolata.AAC.5
MIAAHAHGGGGLGKFGRGVALLFGRGACASSMCTQMVLGEGEESRQPSKKYAHVVGGGDGRHRAMNMH